jgi:hypothetical protein
MIDSDGIEHILYYKLFEKIDSSIDKSFTFNPLTFPHTPIFIRLLDQFIFKLSDPSDELLCFQLKRIKNNP